MKTLFMILALLTFTSVSAYAENWQYITDSEDANYPGRTLIDADSFVRIMVKDKHSLFKARIRVVNTNANPPDWDATVVIDFDQCLKSNNGNMLFMPDGEKHQKYFWDINGSRMYDYVGAWMCGFASTHKDDPAYNPPAQSPKKDSF